MTTPATVSILTYLVTKTLGSQTKAEKLAKALTAYVPRKQLVVTKTGPKAWEVKAFVLDLDIEEVKPLLGEGYGIQTFTTA